MSKLNLVLFCLIQSCIAYYPVVIMHGIGADNGSTASVIEWIHEALGNDVYVKNVEIGDGYYDSFFMEMNDQVQDFCEQMAADPNLVGGFNLIGYSQGGLVTRGFVERCNYPPVKKLYNMGSSTCRRIWNSKFRLFGLFN